VVPFSPTLYELGAAGDPTSRRLTVEEGGVRFPGAV